MKNISSKILAIILVFVIVIPSLAFSQAETGLMTGAGQARSESDAINQALVNTIMPVAVGYGTVALFDNHTMKTIGATLVLYGLIMGPSTGNFYANDYLRGGLGALTRVGAAFLLQNATSEIFGHKFAKVLDVDNKDVSFRDTDILVGSVLMVGTIAFNIITAPVSVREYNRKMGYSVKLQSLPGTGHAAPVFTARIHL